MLLPNHKLCFGCSPDNPTGLHLKWEIAGRGITAEMTVKNEHCRRQGTAHEGILTTMLDEIMGYAVFERNIQIVTLKMKTNFLSTAHVGENLYGEAWVTEIGEHHVNASGVITSLNDGRKIAESSAVFAIVDYKKLGIDSVLKK